MGFVETCTNAVCSSEFAHQRAVALTELILYTCPSEELVGFYVSVGTQV